MVKAKFKAINEKLENLMEMHDMIATFSTDNVPITLTVKMNPATSEQLSMIEAGGETSSADAEIKFIFENGEVTVNTSGKLFMSESLMNKLKGIGKKMHYLFLQMYFLESKGYKEPDEITPTIAGKAEDVADSSKDDTKKEAEAAAPTPEEKPVKKQKASAKSDK